MNLPEYIASGVLELFVLGKLDPTERAEVEANAARYPELRREIADLELTLERLALAEGVTPDAGVLERVLKSVRGPDSPQAAAPHDRVAPLAEVQTRGGSWTTWVALFLAGLFAALAYMSYRYQRATENRLGEATERFEVLERECAEAAETARVTRRRLRAITRPETRDIILAGTDNAPDSRATVYYNPVLEQTLFTARNLPAPPAGKQYQLWAIDAEGPKDLGVLAPDLEGEALLNVSYIADVAAFAITLEVEGGKPVPDLTAVQVIGNVD